MMALGAASKAGQYDKEHIFVCFFSPPLAVLSSTMSDNDVFFLLSFFFPL